ncbi:hypothetical protein NDU88_006927 [Pleurodeles waltl]|uniref:Prohibitin n=1 Tax=Pleurodeles waltl TaxID=8319 RepID=A0AAV7MLE7_PLEWA|nr:hypothetical protein NDU88_006927 [Pleurodeles waltl]
MGGSAGARISPPGAQSRSEGARRMEPPPEKRGSGAEGISLSPLFITPLPITPHANTPLGPPHCRLDDLAITELSFSREYTAAIESKQVAQQEAQRAQFLVEKAKQDQKQKIVQAEGEAAAAKMIGESLSKNPGYLKLRRIRAAQAIAKTIAASQNRVYLNSISLVMNLQEDSFARGSDSFVEKQQKK